MYYNIQLLPSYEVNIESCQPEDGCVLIENTDTYLSHHDKAEQLLNYYNHTLTHYFIIIYNINN
jgi:hypothetical protein